MKTRTAESRVFQAAGGAGQVYGTADLARRVLVVPEVVLEGAGNERHGDERKKQGCQEEHRIRKITEGPQENHGWSLP